MKTNEMEMNEFCNKNHDPRLMIEDPNMKDWPYPFPSYFHCGRGWDLPLERIPIGNMTITDLHLKEGKTRLSLNGKIKTTHFRPYKWKIRKMWGMEHDLQVEIKDTLELIETPVEDISFIVDSSHQWNQPFNLNEMLFKELSSRDIDKTYLNLVDWRTLAIRRPNLTEGWAFEGTIESAQVSFQVTPPSDAKLPWESNLGIRGTVQNVQCRTKGDSWIIGRPIWPPGSKEAS